MRGCLRGGIGGSECIGLGGVRGDMYRRSLYKAAGADIQSAA